MRTRTTILLGAAVIGAGYLLWRAPATQRFITTVRQASAVREEQLREAVEVAVRTDATTRAPRHADDARIPDLNIAAGWPAAESGRHVAHPDDPAQSLTPEQARALLSDPTAPQRRAR